ncbi:hypothetical protein BST81_15705 [Leptolyngbya sp. 'hensonii']|uniref:DUF7219 family protein n=1 Tax=Leptolyngbya sp. 'hensonii' TaxID=1922337 RepID=UPI00094F68F3|nr:hypothetical protein [Leptolyngbya sp. 'hensonii']OLP17263.1 hypothetical protein BST81_15705 [Leptolyngbya sp. 'hensonii']
MNEPEINKDRLLYPRSRYYGHFKPEYLLFNSNLQEFAHRIGYIANLETAGKLSPEESFQQIEALWQAFNANACELGVCQKNCQLEG